MTAGPGPGPHGNPEGQGGAQGQPDPQGWGAPQGQPPYGQPPQGQPPYGQPQGQPPTASRPTASLRRARLPTASSRRPASTASAYGQSPYGQQSYPGHGPAPSAPTGYGAPRPMERPLTVRAGIGAFVASILLSLASALVSLLNWDQLQDVARAQAEVDLGELSPEEAEFTAGLFESIGPIALIAGLIATAVFALFVWFAWKGHNWARVVLWVLAGLGLLLVPLTFAAGGPLPVLTFLAGFEALADLVGIVLLALKPSNEWYRYRGWLRATGQPG